MLVMERNTIKSITVKSIEDYTLEELKTLDNSKFELDQAEQLDYNNNVVKCDYLGFSGKYIGYMWLVYTLTDGTEINIYYR